MQVMKLPSAFPFPLPSRISPPALEMSQIPPKAVWALASPVWCLPPAGLLSSLSVPFTLKIIPLYSAGLTELKIRSWLSCLFLEAGEGSKCTILHATVEHLCDWVEARFPSTATHQGRDKQFVTRQEGKVGQPTREYLGTAPAGFVLRCLQQLK